MSVSPVPKASWRVGPGFPLHTSQACGPGTEHGVGGVVRGMDRQACTMSGVTGAPEESEEAKGNQAGSTFLWKGPPASRQQEGRAEPMEEQVEEGRQRGGSGSCFVQML